jgi:hypothetical protein
VLTPSLKTARRLTLLWGAYPVHTNDIGSFEEMIAKGKRMALCHSFGAAGAKLVALAGVPFGTPGSTNLLHLVTITGDVACCRLARHEQVHSTIAAASSKSTALKYCIADCLRVGCEI